MKNHLRNNWPTYAVLGTMYILAGIVYFAMINKSQKEPIKSTKTIERTIERKEQAINYYNTQVLDQKKIIESIERSLLNKMGLLQLAKAEKDTAMIIQIQDTVIYLQDIDINHLKKVIDWQDSTIVAQRYIINAKDTIISSYQMDLKKTKRQRNGSLMLNAILTGALIFK